jgi:hypothetical protein
MARHYSLRRPKKKTRPNPAGFLDESNLPHRVPPGREVGNPLIVPLNPGS